VDNIYFHAIEAAHGQVFSKNLATILNNEFGGRCSKFSPETKLLAIHSGGSRNAKLSVVLGSIGGAVTLLVIGVIFLLWWQRMCYRPEIYIDVSGSSSSIITFVQCMFLSSQ
jgi:hypothetical protein